MRLRRYHIIWMAAVFLVMGSVTPAAAKKNNNPGEGPPPEVFAACRDLEEPVNDDGVISISVPGSGSIQFECLWTPENPDTSGNWSGKVGVSSTRELGSLLVFVGDSLPGDICLLEQLTQPEGTVFEFDIPLVDGSEEYWDNATNWCRRFDDGGGRDDLNGEPLHLWVGFRSKPGTEVEITLDVVDLGT